MQSLGQLGVRAGRGALWPARVPGALPRNRGRSGRRGVQTAPPDTPRDRPAPPLIGSAAALPASYWRGCRGAPPPAAGGAAGAGGFALGAAAGAGPARHGAAAAAPPAAAALPRLAAAPGETPRRLPAPAEPLGRDVPPAAAWLGGGGEGRSVPRAVGRLQRPPCPQPGLSEHAARTWRHCPDTGGQVALFALS